MNAFLLVLSVLVMGCATTRISPPKPNGQGSQGIASMHTRSYRFLALGDSYTIGESVSDTERWPVQLVQLLRRERIELEGPTIIAATGWTTDELAKAIDKNAPGGTFDIVSLLIGVNNQYRGRPDEEYRREFKGLLEKSIAFAAGKASHVVVLSIPDWGATPFAEGRDRVKIAEEIDRFNEINHEETIRAGAHYVDVTPVSRTGLRDKSLMADDGLHPSAKMYAEWTRLVKPIALEVFASE